MLHEVQTLRAMCTDDVTVDYQQIANDNIANQIHGFTKDHGKFKLNIIIIHQTHYEKYDWST